MIRIWLLRGLRPIYRRHLIDSLQFERNLNASLLEISFDDRAVRGQRTGVLQLQLWVADRQGSVGERDVGARNIRGTLVDAAERRSELSTLSWAILKAIRNSMAPTFKVPSQIPGMPLLPTVGGSAEAAIALAAKTRVQRTRIRFTSNPFLFDGLFRIGLYEGSDR